MGISETFDPDREEAGEQVAYRRFGLKCPELGPGLHDFVAADALEQTERRLEQAEQRVRKLERSIFAIGEPMAKAAEAEVRAELLAAQVKEAREALTEIQEPERSDVDHLREWGEWVVGRAREALARLSGGEDG